jgi:hypothetical protein
MDKIILKDMEFFGYHGVLPEERSLQPTGKKISSGVINRAYFNNLRYFVLF